jgi:inosine/xanthosine triphosphate pyrophosphatase family protein
MTRRLPPDTRLVVASHNPGKVAEIVELVAPFGLRITTAGELALPEPAETGSSFVANAELKAVAAAKASGLPALADDSGLEVVALGGAPGIYSARWAGPDKDFGVAMRRVHDELDRCRASRPRCGWRGPTGRKRPSRARSTATWSGLPAAARVSVMIQCSSPRAKP